LQKKLKSAFSDWWDTETRDEFDKRAQCFRQQYSDIDVPETDEKIDGDKTLGENIGNIRCFFCNL
jgi:predicted metalloendopeptidase